MKNPKYVVIVSLDAVGETDIDYLRTLPNFKKFYENAAYCDKVKSIYPSLTYPAHCSIITGKYPCNHGVTNNVLVQPKRKVQDWKWQRKYIKATTLYDVAKSYGKTVGAFLWPVTGKSKNIDFHIPEIFSNRWWDNQVFTSLRNGSKIFQLKMFLKFKNLLDGIKQPQLDNFTFSSALYAIKKYRPNLMLIHLTDVDTYKHYGTKEEVRESLGRMDKRLGELENTLKRCDIYDKTTIVLLGDHSQYEADYILYLNKFFREKGWLKYDEDKKIIKKWKVLARDCDGSCYIYIKNTKDRILRSRVYKLLEKIKDTEKYGIDRIYTGKEAMKKGADGDCSFMVEAKRGYYFQNEADVRIYCLDKMADRDKFMIATHGYDPEKFEYKTIFAMKGLGVRGGEYKEEMCLVDEAPTIATMMGMKFPKCDGKVIKEMLDI